MSSTSVSSSVRKGVAAAQEVLDQHEVVAFESVHPISGISTSGIKHRGWTFCTTHGKIANEAEGLALSQTISRRCDADDREDDVILLRTCGEDAGEGEGRPLEKENHLHTPPMLFPHDSLVLAFDPPTGPGGGETGGGGGVQTRVEFNVLDALSCWAVQHRAQDHASFIPEVPYAHKWQPQQQEEISQKLKEGQDATQNSSKTNVSRSNSSSSGSDKGKDSENMEVSPSVIALPMQCQEWDWTYSTPYSCTTRICPPGTSLIDTDTDTHANTEVSAPSSELLSYMTSGGVPLSHTAPSTALQLTHTHTDTHTLELQVARHLWEPTPDGTSGINMAMLKRVDQPILFFDEVLLYQDDLEDCGESAYDVKLRVMPACWFVLARLFTRVDGGRLVMRETRLFHEFGADHVAMELTWKQCSETDFNLQQPRALGGPPSSSSLSSSLPPTPGQWRPPPAGAGAGAVRGPASTSTSTRSSPTISSSQLRDPNVMSSLMPTLPPQFSGKDSSDNGSVTASALASVTAAGSHQYGAIKQPMFKNYSLSLL